jgi:hypothetical protein
MMIKTPSEKYVIGIINFTSNSNENKMTLPPIEYRPFQVGDVIVSNGMASTIVEVTEDLEVILADSRVVSTYNISLL